MQNLNIGYSVLDIPGRSRNVDYKILKAEMYIVTQHYFKGVFVG